MKRTMGEIHCPECENIYSVWYEHCPACGNVLTSVEKMILSFIGTLKDSACTSILVRSVLLKVIFEERLYNPVIRTKAAVNRLKEYYYQYKHQSDTTEDEIRNHISYIKSSSIENVFKVIYKYAFSNNDELNLVHLEGFGISGYFVLRWDIDALPKDKISRIIDFVDIELSRYSKQFGCVDPIINKEKSVLDQSTTNTDARSRNSSNELSDDVNMSVDIESLSLSVRAFNALRRNRVYTLDQLIKILENGDIHNIRGIGFNTIQEIKRTLKTILKYNGTNAEQAPIDSIFPEPDLKVFRDYCREHNTVMFKDLHKLDFANIHNLDNFSMEKLNRVYKRYHFICGEPKTSLEFTQEPVQPVINIHKSNFTLNINILSYFGVTRGTIRKLYSRGYKNLESLVFQNTDELQRLLGKRMYIEFKTVMQKLSSPIKSLIQDIFDRLSKDKRYEIYLQRVGGDSLQEIGDAYNLSRERIRQICEKFDRTVLLVTQSIIEILSEKSGGVYCKDEDVQSFIENKEYAKIILYAIRNSNAYEYLDFAELIIQKSSITNVEKTLYNIAADIIGEGINLFEKQSDIESALYESGLTFITMDIFYDFLMRKNFYFFGEYVAPQRSYGRLCAEIVADEFPNGIRYVDSDILRLRALGEKRLGNIKLPNSNRSLFAAVSRYLILNGKASYTSIKRVHFDSSVISEIKSFIDQHDQKVIYYKEIYSKYEGLLLMTSNINSPEFLHGVLIYKYSDEYTFSRDYLSKQTGIYTFNTRDKVSNILKNAGVAMSKSEILASLPGITEIMLANAVYNSENLIQWESKYYNSIDNLFLDKKNVSVIHDALINILKDNDGYCSESMLYFNLKIIMSDWLSKNNVNSAQNLFYVVAFLFSKEFEFRRPHIAFIHRFTSLTTKDIAYDLLQQPKEMSFAVFFALADRLLWPDETAGLVFNDTISDYIRLSVDTYLQRKHFKLLESDMKIIQEQIDALADGAWYLPLLKFSENGNYLICGYTINGFLVGSIAENYQVGWHVIYPKARDRRYQNGVLVKDDIDIRTYDLLIARVLFDMHIDSISNAKLLSLLQIHMLANKVIPKEIFESEYFDYNSNTFNIKHIH